MISIKKTHEMISLTGAKIFWQLRYFRLEGHSSGRYKAFPDQLCRRVENTTSITTTGESLVCRQRYIYTLLYIINTHKLH